MEQAGEKGCEHHGHTKRQYIAVVNLEKLEMEKIAYRITKNFCDKKLSCISWILECRESFFAKFSAALVSRAR